MSRQNKILIIVIAVLLVANMGLSLGGSKKSSTDYDERMFAIADTTSVRSIRIGEIQLMKKGGWYIGEHRADPAFVDHLLNVLLRVRVKKPVGDQVDGITIKVDKELSFSFSANPTKTKTYFSNEDGAFEVEIPGFTDFVGGIFELNRDQWRDRLIYNGSWRTIQKLGLDYSRTDEADFEIVFEKDFFRIPGVEKVDTATMMNYLNQFQFFQANERISPRRMPELDSIFTATPLAVLSIEDINNDAPVMLKIYPRRPDDGFHVVADPKGEMVVIDRARIAQILLGRESFRAPQN